jgi:dipeptidyl aminopeptidase/acylaminoacyl peptidase
MSSDPSDLPPHLRPFVLPHEPLEPVAAAGGLDLYLPGTTPAPAVLMVHGGPVPPDRPVRPPRWPAYRAYGALLAQAGLVGAMVEHGFVDDDTLPVARDDVRAALEALRDDPRVDADRVGLWFFSAGGFLMGSFLDPVPDGVRAVAGTYAAVGDPELADLGLVDGLDAVPRGSVPLLLVRPEHDFDWIVPSTDDLLSRCAEAGRAVDVIDVSGAHHGFETVDDTDAARDAVRRSIAWWADSLR